jgi:choline dehydrogenase
MKAELSGVVHHPVGSCAMGIGRRPWSIPAARARAGEAAGGRCSVMPLLVGANTNAAAVMIGEKASDLILAQEHSA